MMMPMIVDTITATAPMVMVILPPLIIRLNTSRPMSSVPIR